MNASSRWFALSASFASNSRVCHGLTHISRQESGRFRGLFRLIAAELRTDPASVGAALTRRGRP